MRLKSNVRGLHRRRRSTPDDPVHELSVRPRSSAIGARDRLTRLVVDVGDRSEAWRRAATDAERAFGRWCSAPPGERSCEAGRYLAAIELEEKAAIDFRGAWEACCTAMP
jgi:hypothetical protein